MNKTRLSILVCSLLKRAGLLERLRSIIDPQRTPEVELIVHADNGEMTIGAKRNALLAMAAGDYVAFVDDDDRVSPNYVQKILAALVASPDCVGIEGIITENNLNPKVFIHSLSCRGWYESNGVYYRTPNHLSPIKRELALKAGFPEKNHGEDHDYSNRVRPLLSTETYIKGPIYFYDYMTNK